MALSPWYFMVKYTCLYGYYMLDIYICYMLVIICLKENNILVSFNVVSCWEKYWGEAGGGESIF